MGEINKQEPDCMTAEEYWSSGLYDRPTPMVRHTKNREGLVTPIAPSFDYNGMVSPNASY